MWYSNCARIFFFSIKIIDVIFVEWIKQWWWHIWGYYSGGYRWSTVLCYSGSHWNWFDPKVSKLDINIEITDTMQLNYQYYPQVIFPYCQPIWQIGMFIFVSHTQLHFAYNFPTVTLCKRICWVHFNIIQMIDAHSEGLIKHKCL